MLHTQYVFVYGDTCILVINFAPPKVKSWLRHCSQATWHLLTLSDDIIMPHHLSHVISHLSNQCHVIIMSIVLPPQHLVNATSFD